MGWVHYVKHDGRILSQQLQTTRHASRMSGKQRHKACQQECKVNVIKRYVKYTPGMLDTQGMLGGMSGML